MIKRLKEVTCRERCCLAISGISLSLACGSPVASLLFIGSLGIPLKSMGFPFDPFLLPYTLLVYGGR